MLFLIKVTLFHSHSQYLAEIIFYVGLK